MSLLYVANIEYDLYSGIYKKIEKHLEILSKLSKKSRLICKFKGNLVILNFEDGKLATKEIVCNQKDTIASLNKLAINQLKEKKFDYLYFRNTLKPSVYQLLLFRQAKKNGVKIIYELPTFPYYKEQISVAKNKLFTFFKLTIDFLTFPILYHYSNVIPVIISNSKKRILKKMFAITNGISDENIPLRSIEEKTTDLNLVGVGTLYPYHGFDRIIRSLELQRKYNFNFYIIGDGPDIENLKKISKKLNVDEKVHFLGRLDRDELAKVFETMDIGISALALYKRGADLDTTIKLVDYLCRGIPSVSSGKQIYHNNLIFEVSNNDSLINLDEVGDWFNNLNEEVIKKEQGKNIEKYSWEYILKEIFIKVEVK
ncbi:glycosyltransferase [Enterococcus gallinarum]|uniref:Group 1 glycosyl transferase n=1 Tax=Enterococcus gallinarum TaxID=1353 RepID=A0A376GZR2_ENTGA|nr:glycosyltransferase [Enterococcus gallinarum]OJG49873.1 hypothetical protein RV03_GL002983 [Enterococcus gallinarum]STD81628.1 group 1 glycosyl transferase [Enterococcus gallinarum]STE01299.1 group 1 glycosyl transferase [Enterococcus gallinarum]